MIGYPSSYVSNSKYDRLGVLRNRVGSLGSFRPHWQRSVLGSVEVGHVRLVLLHDENSSFHLDISLDIIESLCSKPLKYLHFLGWCILGVEAVLTYRPDGDEVDTDSNLSEHEIYYYNAGNEAMKVRSLG